MPCLTGGWSVEESLEHFPDYDALIGAQRAAIDDEDDPVQLVKWHNLPHQNILVIVNHDDGGRKREPPFCWFGGHPQW